MFSKPITSLHLSASALTALQRAGFRSVSDLSTLSAEQLSEDIGLPVFLCEEILKSANRNDDLPQTQSASSLLSAARSSYSICEPVDEIIGGGLKPGCVLELSGPPGSPKEAALLDLVRTVTKQGEEVLFLDAQNAVLPHTLKHTLKDLPGALSSIHYLKCLSLVDFMSFIHNLPTLLAEHPKISLVALDSFSFLFQMNPLTNAARNSLLDRTKLVLAKICASKQVTVATTVHLATKMLSADGSPANFDTAKKAVMVPQLGDAYLPTGRSYRLMFILGSPLTGVIRLLASPSHSPGRLRAKPIEVQYEMVDSKIQKITP